MNLPDSLLKEHEHEHVHRHLTSRQRAILTLAGIFMLAGLLLAIWIGLARTAYLQRELDEAQESVGQVSQENNQILQTLEDCTKEGGECYARQQEQTAGVIRSINDAVIFSAWCAHELDNPTAGEVRLCVERLVDIEAGR